MLYPIFFSLQKKDVELDKIYKIFKHAMKKLEKVDKIINDQNIQCDV